MIIFTLNCGSVFTWYTMIHKLMACRKTSFMKFLTSSSHSVHRSVHTGKAPRMYHAQQRERDSIIFRHTLVHTLVHQAEEK